MARKIKPSFTSAIRKAKSVEVLVHYGPNAPYHLMISKAEARLLITDFEEVEIEDTEDSWEGLDESGVCLWSFDLSCRTLTIG